MPPWPFRGFWGCPLEIHGRPVLVAQHFWDFRGWISRNSRTAGVGRKHDGPPGTLERALEV
jgi:hypothetical protein